MRIIIICSHWWTRSWSNQSSDPQRTSSDLTAHHQLAGAGKKVESLRQWNL